MRALAPHQSIVLTQLRPDVIVCRCLNCNAPVPNGFVFVTHLVEQGIYEFTALCHDRVMRHRMLASTWASLEGYGRYIVPVGTVDRVLQQQEHPQEDTFMADSSSPFAARVESNRGSDFQINRYDDQGQWLNDFVIRSSPGEWDEVPVEMPRIAEATFGATATKTPRRKKQKKQPEPPKRKGRMLTL